MDLGSVIGKALSNQTKVFDQVVNAIETHSDLPRSSIAEIRQRNPAQVKGRAWEQFCQLWISARYDWVEKVYLLEQTSVELREQLGLRKQDLGIDLIVETKSGEFIAVQAKYRSCVKKISKVPWSHLSTFWGLVARSGPWKAHWVMTNCSGISWKVPKTDKDRTLAMGTFRKTPSETWLKMSGDSGQKLNDSARSKPLLTPAQLRQKRLEALGV